jgi:hypothetical protein
MKVAGVRSIAMGLAMFAGSWPGPVLAQEATGSVATLGRLKPGETVWVTSARDPERKGRVIAVSSSEFRFRVNGRETVVPLDALRRVEVSDPVANGVRNGLIAGAAGGFGFALFMSALVCDVDDCVAQFGRDFPLALLWTGIGAGAGGALGYAIDRAGGRRVIYGSPGSFPMVLIRPSAGPRHAGLRVTFAW